MNDFLNEQIYETHLRTDVSRQLIIDLMVEIVFWELIDAREFSIVISRVVVNAFSVDHVKTRLFYI